MSKHDWDGLIRRMQFARDPTPKPFREACREFERKSGLVDLPPSYCEFCERLGPGVVGLTYTAIACPGYPELGSVGDLWQCHEFFRDCFDNHDLLLEGDLSDEDRELYDGMVGFGSDRSGIFFAWDPFDIRDPSGPEFSIYAVTREFELFRLADSFFAFLDEFCCGHRADLLYTPPDEDCPHPFEPLF